MALFNCIECLSVISGDAEKCPSCNTLNPFVRGAYQCHDCDNSFTQLKDNCCPKCRAKEPPFKVNFDMRVNQPIQPKKLEKYKDDLSQKISEFQFEKYENRYKKIEQFSILWITAASFAALVSLMSLFSINPISYAFILVIIVAASSTIFTLKKSYDLFFFKKEPVEALWSAHMSIPQLLEANEEDIIQTPSPSLIDYKNIENKEKNMLSEYISYSMIKAMEKSLKSKLYLHQSYENSDKHEKKLIYYIEINMRWNMEYIFNKNIISGIKNNVIHDDLFFYYKYYDFCNKNSLFSRPNLIAPPKL